MFRRSGSGARLSFYTSIGQSHATLQIYFMVGAYDSNGNIGSHMMKFEMEIDTGIGKSFPHGYPALLQHHACIGRTETPTDWHLIYAIIDPDARNSAIFCGWKLRGNC